MFWLMTLWISADEDRSVDWVYQSEEGNEDVPEYERVPADAVHGPALAGPEKGQPATVQVGSASSNDRP